jgi:hypothetical protein
MFPTDIAAMVAAAVMAFGAGSVAIASRRAQKAKSEAAKPSDAEAAVATSKEREGPEDPLSR